MRTAQVETLAVGAFVAGVVASVFALVHPWFDAVNDGSMYILTARALLEGEGYSYNGVPFIIRPPGFSVLIAPVLAVFGTSFQALNLCVCLSGAATVLLAFSYFRRRLGWLLALATAAAIWLNPVFRRLCSQVMSDVPGTTLLFSCLLLERWSARSPSPRRAVVLGIAIGLSFYVRSTLALLVPAVLLAQCFQRPPAGLKASQGKRLRHASFFVAAALLVMLPWVLRNHLSEPPIPVDQTRHYSYSTAMWHVDSGDPRSPRLGLDEILERSESNGARVLGALGNRLIEGESEALAIAFGFLLLACTVTRSIRRRESSEFFAIGLMAAVAVSFDFANRHLLPLYLIALPCAVEGVRAVLARARMPYPGAVTSIALVGLIVWDWNPRPDWSSIQARHEALSGICRKIDKRLEPDARLGSTHGWYYSLFLERPVYNLNFAVDRSGRPDTVEEIVDRYRLNTIALAPELNPDPRLLHYVRAKYGAELRKGLYLVRVRP